jgi:hypothetical protein
LGKNITVRYTIKNIDLKELNKKYEAKEIYYDKYVYTIVGLFCDNGFLRAISH